MAAKRKILLTSERINCAVPVVEALATWAAVRRLAQKASVALVALVTSNAGGANAATIAPVALHGCRAIDVAIAS